MFKTGDHVVINCSKYNRGDLKFLGLVIGPVTNMGGESLWKIMVYAFHPETKYKEFFRYSNLTTKFPHTAIRIESILELVTDV